MPFQFTLRQLEYFVGVGQAESIVGASDNLNVSSPSISAAIIQLEEDLGLTLFVREHAKGVKLTAAGERFFAQTEKVMAEADQMLKLAGEMTGAPQGRLLIGSLLPFAQTILPTLRRDFARSRPKVQVIQRVLTQAEIFSQLRRRELDLALTLDLDTPPDLDFQRIANLPPYVVCHPEHPLATHASISVEDLADYPMVLLDLPYSSDVSLSIFSRAGLQPQVVERTSDMAVMHALVANGFGFSIINMPLATAFAPDGRPLRTIPLKSDNAPLQLGLLQLRKRAKSATLADFVNHFVGMVENGAFQGLRGHDQSAQVASNTGNPPEGADNL